VGQETDNPLLPLVCTPQDAAPAYAKHSLPCLPTSPLQPQPGYPALCLPCALPQLGVSSLTRTPTDASTPPPHLKQAEEKRVLTCQRHDLPSSSGREAEDCLLCLLQLSHRTRDHLALLAGESQGVRL